jgi:hypothetical protein
MVSSEALRAAGEGSRPLDMPAGEYGADPNDPRVGDVSYVELRAEWNTSDAASEKTDEEGVW